MDDRLIVQLYWDRNESAISESSKKYGAYCASIARNILQNASNAEECVNDTWLHAWNSMPPQKPSVLSAFLGRITRNLSFDLFRRLHREKRGGGNIDIVLDELAECVSGKDDTDRLWEEKELRSEIDRFLSLLPEDKRYPETGRCRAVCVLRCRTAREESRRSAIRPGRRSAAPFWRRRDRRRRSG